MDCIPFPKKYFFDRFNFFKSNPTYTLFDSQVCVLKSTKSEFIICCPSPSKALALALSILEKVEEDGSGNS